MEFFIATFLFCWWQTTLGASFIDNLFEEKGSVSFRVRITRLSI
jgi:hypothetical protein